MSFLSKITIEWDLLMSCKESLVKAKESCFGRDVCSVHRPVGVYLIFVPCAMVFSASIVVSPVVNAQDQVFGRVPENPAQRVHEIAQLSTKAFINAVAWSPNGKYLAALSYYGTTITVWDTQT